MGRMSVDGIFTTRCARGSQRESEGRLGKSSKGWKNATALLEELKSQMTS